MSVFESLRNLWSVCGHLVLAIVVLILTVGTSVAIDFPVRSIIPYAISVSLSAWRYGLMVGFVFAGLATLAALAAGAFPTRSELTGQEVGEGVFTYLKLSAIAAGVVIGKKVNRTEE